MEELVKIEPEHPVERPAAVLAGLEKSGLRLESPGNGQIDLVIPPGKVLTKKQADLIRRHKVALIEILEQRRDARILELIDAGRVKSPVVFVL